MRICFERLCFATKRPAVDDDQIPQLDNIKTIDTFNVNTNSNSIINTTAITSLTTTTTTTTLPSVTDQYSKYIKNNYKENFLNNNNNKNHIYQNISPISLNSDSITKPIINSSDIIIQHQSKIYNNNKQIINHKNNEKIIFTNEEEPIKKLLANQNKITEFLAATTNSENSNPETTFAVIGDKVVNINNIEFATISSPIVAATISDATNNCIINKIDSNKLDKMHEQESSTNNSKSQLESGTTSELTDSTADTVTLTFPPVSINNNPIIPADILQSSLIFGTNSINLNDPNLDIETINYINKQQQQLQKLYQQQLQHQLQHIQQQAQSLFQPNIQISDPSIIDGNGSVNNNLIDTIAPPPSSLPLPLPFQQQQQFSATQMNEFNNNLNNNSGSIVHNPVISNQMQGLNINSVETTSISILPSNMVTNNNYVPSTPQEQQFIQMIQVKDLKIQELQRVLQFKENEIAELKSHLDKFQSVFPFSRSSSGGGGGGGGSTSNATTPTGPGLRKTGQAFQRQRAQGISAEPQSESSVMELLHVTFPKYEKDER